MTTNYQVFIDIFNLKDNKIKKSHYSMMTIKMFQDLFTISQTEMDEIDKSILLVQAYTGKSEFEINRMSVKKFNRLCLKIKKAFDNVGSRIANSKPKNLIKANGKWYWLNFEINEMTAGRYVETATFGTDIVGNLHKLMATMCTPMKWSWKGLVFDKYKAENHSKYADDMLEADFDHCYQACVFFWAVFNESMKVLQSSLEGSQIEKEILNQHLMNFKEVMDGFLMPNWYLNLKISV